MKLFSLLLLLFLCACTSHKTPQDSQHPVAGDSIAVSGFQSGQELQNLQYIHPDTLVSYDPQGNQLCYFTKTKPGLYAATSRYPTPSDSWSSMFINGQHFAFISRNNALSMMNKTGDTLFSKKQFHHHFTHLGEAFMSISQHDAEAAFFHDTLLLPFAHNNLESYQKLLEENEFMEFKKEGDSLRFIQTGFPKPPGLKNYNLPLAKYCRKGSRLYVIYPCYDTLYVFDHISRNLNRIAIGNKDYELPETYRNKAFTPSYGSYQTRYELNNFAYSAIYYNPSTRHFVLFYYSPVKPDDTGHSVTPDDQKLQALVLDEAFQNPLYYCFTKTYVNPCSFFIIPGKGLVMPRFKDYEHYEKTVFDIYNF